MIASRKVSLLILFTVAFWAAALAQTAPPQSRDVIIIEGMVRSSSGDPVAGASVVLEGKDQPKPVESTTNNDGTFVFTPEHPGTFKLTAKKSGYRDVVVEGLALSPGEKKRVNLVLENPAAPQSSTMEFSDQPNFTVAGVTDYTAAGGHGADTSLRTSESLARETLTLKSEHAGSVGPDRETENKLRAALAQAPASFEANRNLGKLYCAAGKYGEAIPLLETAHKINSADFSTGYDLAFAYKSGGDLPKARQQIQQMLASSNRAELHRLLGDIDEQSGDPLQAVREYEASARLDPSEENYFGWGAELLLHRAILPAIEVFTKGSELHKDSARMLSGLGAALYASGRYPEAAQRICAAADLRPKDETPYLFLGKMQKAASGPLPCSEDKLAYFANSNPQNPLANYYYAVALWKRSKALPDSPELRRAEQLLQTAVRLDPKCGEAYLQLGNIYAGRGALPQAVRSYQKAILTDSQLAEAHYRLGQAYKRTGDQAKAQHELQTYEQVQKTETAEIEHQRKDLQQFMVVLKDASR